MAFMLNLVVFYELSVSGYVDDELLCCEESQEDGMERL